MRYQRFEERVFSLTEGSILKAVWKLGWPTMVTIAFQDLFSLVDMFFVGKLGKEAIASVSICGVLLGFVFTIVLGISIGSVALVARFMGRKDFQKVEEVAVQAILLGGGTSIFMMLAGFLYAEPLLRLLGARGEVLYLGTSYLKIISLGAFTVFLAFSLNAVLRGTGDALTPMKIMALSNFINLVLDPFLIFGIWKFPRMGVAGSALATVLARLVGMVLILRVFFRGTSYLHLKWKNFRPRIDLMGRILRVGFFGSLQVLLRNFVAVLIMRIVAPFGAASLAAYGIVMRVLMVVLMPGMGIGNATSVLIGQCLGAGKKARARKTGWMSAGIYQGFLIFISLIFFLFASSIIKVFTANPVVVKLGSDFLKIISLSFPFLALSTVLGRGLQGAGDTLGPLLITALTLILFQIPLVISLSQFFGPQGIGMGISISTVIHGVLITLWFQRGKWQKKKI